MNFKKILAFITVAVMLVGAFSVNVFAVDESVTVYVTISNGSLAIIQEPITVTDVDEDGALTINDALYIAHEKKFTGGADAGYASASGAYGLGITKLWGVENGGSYGYYVNNEMAMGLTDTLKNNDYINAFVYTDTDYFSDVYCYFNAYSASETAGKEFILTLSAAGFDEDFNPVVLPLADAIILIDGVESSFKTDADGKVKIKIDSAKTVVISAKSESSVLVPPACVVTLSADTTQTESTSVPQTTEKEIPNTGDMNSAIYIVAAMIMLGGVLLVLFSRKNIYEK